MALRDMSPRLKAGEEERDPLTTEKGRDMVRFLVEEMKVSVDFVTPNKGLPALLDVLRVNILQAPPSILRVSTVPLTWWITCLSMAQAGS